MTIPFQGFEIVYFSVELCFVQFVVCFLNFKLV